MNISVLCKGKFESLPAVMSLAIVIKELGHDVEVITSSSEPKTKDMFAEKGINITDVYPEIEPAPSTILKKVRFWRTFAKRAWSHIDQKARDTFLWVSAADTALALGKRLLRQDYTLHILELYDKSPLYRRALAKYAQQASCVVVPEMCRAAIFRSWYGLKQTPLVLPNKPADHPHQQNLKIEDEQARDILAALGPDEKLVLYQGHIGFDRDIRPVADAVRNIGDGWRFAAMGPAHGEYLNMLKKTCPDAIYIPRVVAPSHLQITSQAHIGVTAYSWDTLNNVFCAPNKVWEYAGFGLPMLCSDLPPLQFLVQANNAGICVDMTDRGQIESALKKIDDNYVLFSQAARRLYDSVDIRDIIQRIIDRANLRASNPRDQGSRRRLQHHL